MEPREEVKELLIETTKEESTLENGKMQQEQRILLLGSTGYLGRTLMRHLSQRGHVIPTYRTSTPVADSHRYDFWTDDVHSLVEQHHHSHENAHRDRSTSCTCSPHPKNE